jgi:hypothetical protein
MGRGAWGPSTKRWGVDRVDEKIALKVRTRIRQSAQRGGGGREQHGWEGFAHHIRFRCLHTLGSCLPPPFLRQLNSLAPYSTLCPL